MSILIAVLLLCILLALSSTARTLLGVIALVIVVWLLSL